jgi:hypothetical protein
MSSRRSWAYRWHPGDTQRPPTATQWYRGQEVSTGHTWCFHCKCMHQSNEFIAFLLLLTCT